MPENVPDGRPVGAVIIGSGFGGTIAALTLANYFAEQNKGKTNDDEKQKVVILERGQWWLSHETPFSQANAQPDSDIAKINLLEYVVKTKAPFNFWAHPDNIEGIFNLISMTRSANERGLYDFHSFANTAVNVVTASGVGGGSLVYSNVTIRPEKSVYGKFPQVGEDGLDAPYDLNGQQTYFDKAEEFIGVNKITTNAGLGGSMLERSKVFQDAAKNLADRGVVINKDDYSLNLAISDIPDKLFDYFTESGYGGKGLTKNNLFQLTPDLVSKLPPELVAKFQTEDIVNIAPDLVKQLVPEIIAKYQNSTESNICQRQARCNLGCIPGARHTMNKKLFQAIKSSLPLKVMALCRASKIEYHEEDKESKYHIQYQIYQNDKWEDQPLPLKTNILIVSAGTLGSTELLLQSHGKNLELSPRRGEKFATNADLLAAMKLQTRQIDSTRGPINTSHAKFAPHGEFAFNIEDTSVPPMFANLFATMFENNRTMQNLAVVAHRILIFFNKPTLGIKLHKKRSRKSFSTIKSSFPIMKPITLWSNIPIIRELISQPQPTADGNPSQIIREQRENVRNDLGFLYDIANWLFSNKKRPFDSPAQRLSRFFVFSCMGMDNETGKFEIKNNKFELDWKPEKNTKIFSDIINGVSQLANEIEPNGGNEKNLIIPTWNEESPEDSNVIVLHPLGGCPMGNTIDEGVVDCYGNVFKPDDKKKDSKYPGFYVIDGSIIPGPIGVNPSLTISALAFRCMKNAIKDSDGKPIGHKYWPSSQY